MVNIAAGSQGEGQLNEAASTEQTQGCGHGSPSISVDEARARIRDLAAPVTVAERVPLRQALGRVLAEAVPARVDVPGHDNSAMDGYAVRAEDLAAGNSLRVVGEAFAGHPFAGTVGAGECVRIMTGGVMPAGADTVVMQERARREGNDVWFEGALDIGTNVRRRGEDLRAGDTVLSAGRRLAPADLGLLASVGVGEVAVRRRLRVAMFSTGDELRSLGEPLSVGQIYDSNRYTIHGMLERAGAEVLDLGVVRDQKNAIAVALDAAAANADVVITSGGVSVGEADYVTDLLTERGTVGFWTVDMKPGRPLAFGHLGPTVFFGLPGNPVSVMVTFYQIVLPSLLHMQGLDAAPRLQIRARLTAPLSKKDRRREFQRGVLAQTADGTLTVRVTGNQGSGILRSMSDANCFLVLPEGPADLQTGDLVTVEPFADFV